MKRIEIDKNTKLRVLDNKVSTICIWDYREQFLGYGDDGQIKKMNPFVERVQFMTATGGNVERDLFRDPENVDVRDDYDFSRLITACENALRLGVKPFIKTGSIPVKLTKEPKIGKFGVNMHAPDDMDEYYSYIFALCEELKSEFGIDEVRTWSFGVFTEFENKEWFKADEESSEISAKKFCDIYDYTVAAIADSLGEEVTVGAHAMTVTDITKLIVFDSLEFVKHCAMEKNAKNGKPVRLDYMAVSYYDGRPYMYCFKSLAQVVNKLRAAFAEYGIHNVRFACDEGRINSGNDEKELSPRTVGYRYQAAMDADLLWQMVNTDIDYFAAWSYLSGGLMDGIKSVGSHMAECYYDMVGMTQVKSDDIDIISMDPGSFRVNSVAAVDDSGKMTVMAYNYMPGKYAYDTPEEIEICFNTELADGEYIAQCKFIDDSCNFYPHWAKDRDAAGLKTLGRWSEESPEVMTEGFDCTKYEQYSHLVPQDRVYTVKNGKASISLTLVGNSAVFVDF